MGDGRSARARRAGAADPPARRPDSYEEIPGDLRGHYEATGSQHLQEAAGAPQRLDEVFTGRRVLSIGRAEVTADALARQQTGAAKGAINRERAVLDRMLDLAY